MTANDEEAASLFPPINVFDNKAVRRTFIGKVFILVALQLTVVTASVLICMLVDSIYDCLTAEDNFHLIVGAFCASVATYIISVVLYCFISVVRKRSPDIIVLLSTVTMSSAIIFSIACTTFGITALIAFLGITVSCCIGVSIFSFVSTNDLGFRQAVMFCLLWGALSTAFAICVPFSTTSIKVAAGSVSVVIMFIMVYDIYRFMDRSKATVLSLGLHLDGVFELHSDIFIIFTILFVILALLITCRCTAFKSCGRRNEKNTPYPPHNSQPVDTKKHRGPGDDNPESGSRQPLKL